MKRVIENVRVSESLRDLQIYADNLKMAQQIRRLKLISCILVAVVLGETLFVVTL